MNTNYYANPIYPNINNNGFDVTKSKGIISMPNNNMNNTLSVNSTNNAIAFEEQSYVENILRLNKGKLATFYFSYPDSVEWRDRTYTGIIEAAGRDHIIISEPDSGRRYLLLNIYLNYVEFNEKIDYRPEFYTQS